MKESQREPVINFGNIERYSKYGEIQGNIVTTLVSENETLYILTDISMFYYQEKGKKKEEFILIPTISIDQDKYQTQENVSRLWCDKFGYHTLIHHDKRVFYFNPSINGPKEINLENKNYLEPYAVAFNSNDILAPNNKNNIDILFSDYLSDIYVLNIKIERDIPKINYNLVYKLRNDYDDRHHINMEDNFGFPEFNLFNLEKNERITDLKILKSNQKDKEELLIIAITKNTIFKFVGSGSFKEIFDNYTMDKDDFQKIYKKLSHNKKEKQFEKCRLQLLKSYSFNSLTKQNLELCLGWMSSCGYILEEIQYINNKITPKKNFSVFPYVKFKLDGTRDYNPIPTMVCQSKLHIFFLYNDCLIVTNKLNKNIIHVEYLLTNYNDMYYIESLNCIVLSTIRDVFMLNLDNEDKYIWENYVEIGKYDLAIKSLSKEEQYLKPKLHRLNAEKLFKEGNYDKAAIEYNSSDEIFESVCVKFIMANQFNALLKYLNLVKNTKLSNYNKKDDTKNYLSKYLIYTWIAELLVEQENINNNNKDLNLKEFIEETKHNHTDKYIDKMTYYFLLLNYGKKKEFLDYAMLKGDYELILQNLINHLNYDEVLNNLEKFMSSDIDERIMKKLIKIIFEYSNYFMKESPTKTINLLEKEFISETNQDDIVKIIIDSNIKQEIKKGNYDTILNYIRKLIKKNVMNNLHNDNKKVVSPSTINNLHNLYILFLSLSDKPEHKKEVIEYLKGPMYTITPKNNYLNVTLSNKEIHIDLNFAQKILQNNYSALALIYCLMGRYNESILIALEHNEKDIAIFIAQNIKDDKIKKDIWLRIFKYFKTNNFADAKNILESSMGILKIEDILPFMMDNVKLEELKTDLQACINFYEEGVQQLKQEINDYNQSTEIIKKDIYKIQKKSTYINYNQIKCEKCQKDIMGAKFFLFPCGHIFDTFCLIKILIDYDEQNIGDEYFRIKVNNIKTLREKIRLLQEKRKKIINEQKLQNSNINTFKVFFNFINKEQREEFSKEEEIQLKEYSDNLYRLLKEECVLCGKEMINSTQVKLGEDEDRKWNDLV
jgi:hypothetical protein